MLKKSCDIGGAGGEKGNLGKRLRVERSGRNFMGRINRSPKYVIDITGSYPLPLGELEGGYFQCFGDFGASGRDRTMQIGRHVRDMQELIW